MSRKLQCYRIWSGDFFLNIRLWKNEAKWSDWTLNTQIVWLHDKHLPDLIFCQMNIWFVGLCQAFEIYDKGRKRLTKKANLQQVYDKVRSIWPQTPRIKILLHSTLPCVVIRFCLNYCHSYSLLVILWVTMYESGWRPLQGKSLVGKNKEKGESIPIRMNKLRVRAQGGR